MVLALHFLTKLLQGTVDESVHRVFLRYGKGDYEGPAAEITISKTGKIKVRSTYQYQDLVAMNLLKVIPDSSIDASGIILAYEKLDDALKYLEIEAPPFTKKRAMLLYQTKITGGYSKDQLFSLYNEIGERGYVFLNLSAGSGWSHKTKTKMPSMQKEAPIDDQLKFSTLRLPKGTNYVEELVNVIAPDFLDQIPKSFTSLRLENHYRITGFEFPPNRDQLSSTELRRLTKRKGTLYRKIFVDDKENQRDHDFEA